MCACVCVCVCVCVRARVRARARSPIFHRLPLTDRAILPNLDVLVFNPLVAFLYWYLYFPQGPLDMGWA